MALSRLGDFVVTGSHDKSLRRWQRSDEPFFLDEEKERRLSALFEGGDANPDQGGSVARRGGEAGTGVEGIVVSSAQKTQARAQS